MLPSKKKKESISSIVSSLISFGGLLSNQICQVFINSNGLSLALVKHSIRHNKSANKDTIQMLCQSNKWWDSRSWNTGISVIILNLNQPSQRFHIFSVL